MFDDVPRVTGGPVPRVIDRLQPVRSLPPDQTVVFVAPDTIAAPRAVRALADRLQSTKGEMVTCDHIVLSPERLSFHKPGISPRLLASGPYLGPVLAVRASLLEATSGASDDHESMIRLVETTEHVEHIDRVWFATREGFGVNPSARAAENVLKNMHSVSTAPLANRPWLQIDLSPRSNHPSTVVIPTRDAGQRLRRLVDSIHSSTLATRVIVVDNASTDTTTLDVLAAIAARDEVTVLPAPGLFNFSRVCNLALSRVETETVAFVNDDVEPLDELWLSQLVANLDDPGIGLVGPQLRFPSGAIQHSGVVLGLGGAAGHGFRGSDPDNDGYVGLSGVRREVSAVTGACLVARTEDLRRIAGFDERYMSDFQDVDLCLRMKQKLGLASVVDPRRPLVHLESATRGIGHAEPADAVLLRRRWGALLDQDPYYSRRLPTVNPGYSQKVGDPTS